MCHPSANSAVLSNTKILKFLGILSDIKLMWKCHIDFISLKLVKATDDILFAYSLSHTYPTGYVRGVMQPNAH